MPKGSFAQKDAYEMKAGFNEGWGEITAARSAIIQYQPNKQTGEQAPPMIVALLSIQRTDESGRPTSDELVEQELKIEGDLSKIRPGLVTSRDDENPQDLGNTIGTEGNCLFVEDGVKINKTSRFMIFERSLEEKGFKPEILGCGYFPDLVGLRAHFKTQPGKKFVGRKGEDVQMDDFVVTKISQYPYEVKAKASGSTGRGRPPAAPKPAADVHVNGSPAPQTEPVEVVATTTGTAADADDVDTVAINAVRAAKAFMKWESGTTVLKGKIKLEAIRQVVTIIKSPLSSQACQRLQNDNWWLTYAVDNAATPVPVGPNGESGDYVMFG